MAIQGIQNINIGLPNESAGSDSLFTAFNKAQTNFTTLFSTAGPVPIAGAGVSVQQVSNSVVVSANLIAGNNVVLTTVDGAIVIDSLGSPEEGTITGVLAGTGLAGGGFFGNVTVGLANSGVVGGTYTNPTVIVDSTGRITSASNNTIFGTVTSVGLLSGGGIQIGGSPITTSGNITITNTGVTRLNAGTGITVSGPTGNVTVSAAPVSAVTLIGITSSQLVVTNSPVTSSGTISVNLPANATFSGNVTANRIVANSGQINGNLVITGNISPAAVGKIGGIQPGPGIEISESGLLTIDNAELPISFGDFFATDNVLSIVNEDEDMIIQTQGNAEIQLVGNIGFYKPDGIPPNTANRYFSATTDGQITIVVTTTDGAGAVQIVGSESSNVIAPGIAGTLLHVTGQVNVPCRLYYDGNGDYVSFVARRWNGNVEAPTQVLAGQNVLRINSTAATEAGVGNVAMAQINTTALENQTTTAQGSAINFIVTPIGSPATSRIEVANITVANGITATKFTTAGTLDVSGNANIGNIGTAGLIIATGNITGGNLITGGALSVTGNANIGNVGTAGLIIATGNITGGNLVTGGTLDVSGNANIGNISSTGIITTTGNITGGNLITGGALSVTGNANIGNIGTAGLIIATGNITGGNLITGGSANITGNLVASGNIGYNIATNHATVTQETNKTTAVTANGRSGQITTSNASLPQNSTVTFTVNNSFVSATDIIILNIQSGASINTYTYEVASVGSEQFSIQLRNQTNSAISEAIVFNFAVIKVS